ncbi:glycosyltransferase [Garciella nitratireducens]|uniref:glycosyltransferase n=1 Tax=Garciella nitratireducens TaxID=218205 RepID=UPI001BD476BE|nr:glycosyltransferase [Garciella nitratireducens]
MKKILLVSYYFYPYNLIGSKRMMYLAKYLMNHEEDVTIVKADNSYYGNNIEQMEEKQYHFNVINVKKKLDFKKQSINEFYWYHTFKKAIEKFIFSHDVKYIYFSGGPFFYFLLGNYFKKKYKIPFVLDFRDPWYDTDFRSKGIKQYLIQYKKRILEKIAVKNADYIINVTDQLTEEYRKRYPLIQKNKFVTIYNGYDDQLLKKLNIYDLSNKKNPEEIHIGIFGKFSYYNKQHGNWLLKYIQKFNKKNQKKIFLHHIGKEEKYLIEKAKDLNIEKYFYVYGCLEYTKGMKILSQMDILILNHRSKSSIGTKIYDYIYLNKPIIAFIEQNSVIGNFLNQFDYAYIVDEEEKLETAFQFILKNNGQLSEHLNKEIYSRKHQMEKLYRILNNL